MKSCIKAVGFCSLNVIIIGLFSLSCLSWITGCSKDIEGEKKTSKETIRVSGAWALYPMMVRWAEEFKWR